MVAAISIVWSISIHILSGDFYNGFIGAKLAFRERDFTQMDNSTKAILDYDLDRIISETYTKEALDDIRPDALVMPRLEETDKCKYWSLPYLHKNILQYIHIYYDIPFSSN